MPNSIENKAAVTTVLDEVFATASVTGDLRTSSDLVRAGATAKEILIPKIEVDGLGDYSRTTGYPSGSVKMSWETVAFNYDRGTKLTVDAMDNAEANGVEPFVKAGAELQRVHVAPEGDAFTFAKIVEGAGASRDVASAGTTYESADELLDALADVSAEMDDAGVPAGRILYITPALKSMLDRYNQVTGKTDKADVLTLFSKVVKVPKSRFYTAIELNSGSEEFGFKKAVGGKELNWMVVLPQAVIKVDKHTVSRVFQPDELEDLDAYMMKYRKYGLVDVYENKVAGIAYSHKA